MKLTPKNKDALACLLWSVLTFANTVAMTVTGENVYGFLMLLSLAMLLEDKHEYIRKHEEKK